jgi:EAL domain-containing protein (putative c-di-GMP-specific phosphodiesterase class I)/ActR/RegA family two-component response regulator
MATQNPPVGGKGDIERYVVPVSAARVEARVMTPLFFDTFQADPNLRLLVVEDDELQRLVLVKRFEQLGVRDIAVAGDGEQALEVLNADPRINLVVTDLDMPRMDGLELIRELGTRAEPLAVALHSAMDSGLLACAALMSRERNVRFLGILTKPGQGDDLARLLGRASKHFERISTAVVKPIDLNAIFAGLANDEFEPFFQPKVRLLDGAVVGAEALARWRSPRLGMVPPLFFIDQLEAAGKLDQLTRVMLRKSFERAATWRKTSGRVGVSVNLSQSFLALTGVSEEIADLAAEFMLPASSIGLEITESVAMTEVGTCLENIARLRMRGFRLSVDDFGVGYSSLQQLVRIPFQELKLDRSFVTNVVAESRAAIVLEATVALARKLDMSTVAEGIENLAEWEFLRGLGCDIAQGYYIAKPMAAPDFATWLDRCPTQYGLQ